MNSLLRIPYTLVGVATDTLVRVAPGGQSKLARGLSGRRGLIQRYRRWGAARDVSRPLVWIHAPSVGEGLQALPVIELLRMRRADVEIAYTFYSPSAEQFARSLAADFADYLPFDTFGHARAIVDALRPAALVFSKLDIWPALTETAAASGVPVGVISATLPESSGRRGPFARALLGDAYQAIDLAGAIDQSDAERLREQGVRADRVRVTGDTRFDQVSARARRPALAIVDRLRSARPTLVAGSTWPSDEEHLLPAWLRIREKIPDARIIIAPHETTTAHLRSVESWAASSALSLARIDSHEATSADIVLVDRYGILGDLYALADVAYVGGGFHAAGIHSVLEPAAFGSPVLFGPRHERSREAARLIQADGGAAIKGAADLTIRLGDWLGSPASRELAGTNARNMVLSGVGAAERSFELITALLLRGQARAAV
ncbi:MAG TPA: glycosyltransferase N-terminal domain-containing protein [Gemmatimonadaceae bacterium]|nr:glycosyltransferase N-terminal domain-containing protein [Gemmatimonadaceae bacterium]